MTTNEIIAMAREADPFGEDGRLFAMASVAPGTLERFAALVAAKEREACAQSHPAAAAEDDDLYWRLHAMSKSLEGAGRLDEHENPDAYATVLDAMNFVQQHSGQRGDG